VICTIDATWFDCRSVTRVKFVPIILILGVLLPANKNGLGIPEADKSVYSQQKIVIADYFFLAAAIAFSCSFAERSGLGVASPSA
jgi:hypothetical protein